MTMVTRHTVRSPSLSYSPKISYESYADTLTVPTTSIYSAVDEIVSPQMGEFASAFLKDARGVGVFNCELQRIAPLTPAVSSCRLISVDLFLSLKWFTLSVYELQSCKLY